MGNQLELTIEQQFNLHCFKDQVARMSKEQAQQMLIELYQNSLVKDTLVKDMVKEKWGL